MVGIGALRIAGSAHTVTEERVRGGVEEDGHTARAGEAKLSCCVSADIRMNIINVAEKYIKISSGASGWRPDMSSQYPVGGLVESGPTGVTSTGKGVPRPALAIDERDGQKRPAVDAKGERSRTCVPADRARLIARIKVKRGARLRLRQNKGLISPITKEENPGRSQVPNVVGRSACPDDGSRITEGPRADRHADTRNPYVI